MCHTDHMCFTDGGFESTYCTVRLTMFEYPGISLDKLAMVLEELYKSLK